MTARLNDLYLVTSKANDLYLSCLRNVPAASIEGVLYVTGSSGVQMHVDVHGQLCDLE